jgi:hypothetical protein
MSYSILVAYLYEYIYIIHKHFDFLNKNTNNLKEFFIVICMNRHIINMHMWVWVRGKRNCIHF